MTALSIKRQVQLRVQPANDNFLDAQQMLRIGDDNSVWERMPSVEVAGATMQDTEPAGDNWSNVDGTTVGYQSLWWRYDPAGSPTVHVRNINSIVPYSAGSADSTGVYMNLVMAVWRGPESGGFGGLTEVDSTLYTTDTGGPYDGELSFAATAGQTYWIQIACALPRLNGAVVLEWRLT